MSAAAVTACPYSNPQRVFEDLAAQRERPGLEYDAILIGYVVSRHSDIVEVLDDPSTFSSRPTVPEFPPPVQSLFSGKVPDRGTLIAHDNPDHDRLRASVASFFVPRRLQRFEPLLRRTAHSLIDDFIAKGSVDVKSAFALPLPLRTIVIVAGLDPERWQWIGRCLSLFGGITRTEEGEKRTVQQRTQDVLDVHEYIASVIELRRHDRRDDLISHIWNERDGPNGIQMTDFEHLSMIPGLLLAGHETTTNFLSMSLAHLLHHDLWEQAARSEASRIAAIEELLRYESAITGMRRTVKCPVTVSGTALQPGDALFLAYASGSRDAAVSGKNGAMIDLDRPATASQHLGFGRGVHACLGAPFARLLLRTELAVLRERLPNLRLVTPYDEIPYKRVHEARGVESMFIAWDPPASAYMVAPPGGLTEDGLVPGLSTLTLSVTAEPPTGTIQAVVEDTTTIAKGVKQITLVSSLASRDSFPKQWGPGAHIDVQTGNLGWRQYSICSRAPPLLQITVLREEGGLGGSQYLHDSVKKGDTLLIRGPRNHFGIRRGDENTNDRVVEDPGAKRTIFIAGGIGITPIRPLAAEAKAAGTQYELVYLGRSRDTMAYADEMIRTHGDDKTTIWVTSEQPGRRRFDLEALLLEQQQQPAKDGTMEPQLEVYCCGPEGLVSRVEAIMETRKETHPGDVLHVERFAHPAESAGDTAENRPFDVLLARSGKVLQVPADKSVLEVINEEAAAGSVSAALDTGKPAKQQGDFAAEKGKTKAIMSTCGKGLCGTCEVPVLEGVPDHRDVVLTGLEKAEGKTMMAFSTWEACILDLRGANSAIYSLTMTSLCNYSQPLLFNTSDLQRDGVGTLFPYNPDLYDSASGLYGPGSLICWCLLIASFIVNFMFCPVDRAGHRRPTITTDLIALTVYPVFAATDALVQAMKLLGVPDRAKVLFCLRYPYVDISKEMYGQRSPDDPPLDLEHIPEDVVAYGQKIIALSGPLPVCQVFTTVVFAYLVIFKVVRHLHAHEEVLVPWSAMDGASRLIVSAYAYILTCLTVVQFSMADANMIAALTLYDVVTPVLFFIVNGFGIIVVVGVAVMLVILLLRAVRWAGGECLRAVYDLPTFGDNEVVNWANFIVYSVFFAFPYAVIMWKGDLSLTPDLGIAVTESDQLAALLGGILTLCFTLYSAVFDRRGGPPQESRDEEQMVPLTSENV
ncbi:cytochrome P450 [Microdochium trichocladiopsis]|uniref:Cytochrome P450 n=1 Tax=Microdochium trichocladiopsis TaxID=1682393 RepID=A0A9P8YAE1_9PEZI|nr:cytochrome P450 [Microdochium trichocladiopsis]KAH7033541.1 cytochrome P450 [Microdochium trichocladiopsis]